MRAGMGYVANPYSRHKHTLCGTKFLDPVFEFPQRHLQPARELTRLGGRSQSSRHSLVQTSSNNALKIASRSMKRRLRYPKPAGRSLERTAFCDRGEYANVGVGNLILHRPRGFATCKRCANHRIAQCGLDVREQPLNPG